eukprot:CAMPEP_0194702260 /NCGR_PEP_ID=MMETSP0295-20121207/26779_1 /TAXON_ID=39354 /ORGANISM="Heterosigma akashiwo, Strain CCMP2393" /LENGTH=78 /DNA_ID=CAMNT_0039596815 /DNA_START=313 /DNA_END=546 /DNA_ORIENTATION=+
MLTSMSGTEASPRSTIRMLSLRKGTSSLLTMNPGVSRQETVVLPTLSPQALHRSNTAGSVPSVRTTSTSFISCTGLKK